MYKFADRTCEGKQHMPFRKIVVFIAVLVLQTILQPQAISQESTDPYTITSDKHLVRDFQAMSADGNINVVVEIPAGSNEKWEVNKETGHLEWEMQQGQPRMIAYLPYPANYGMIPRTLLPKSAGGDGDPLDVVVLGNSVPRGEVISARPIGILRLLDRGEQDDKIIAIAMNSPFSHITDIVELERDFVGVTQILLSWFSNYKGPGKMQANGFGGANEARELIRTAIDSYPDKIYLH